MAVRASQELGLIFSPCRPRALVTEKLLSETYQFFDNTDCVLGLVVGEHLGVEDLWVIGTTHESIFGRLLVAVSQLSLDVLDSAINM